MNIMCVHFSQMMYKAILNPKGIVGIYQHISKMLSNAKVHSKTERNYLFKKVVQVLKKDIGSYTWVLTVL